MPMGTRKRKKNDNNGDSGRDYDDKENTRENSGEQIE